MKKITFLLAYFWVFACLAQTPNPIESNNQFTFDFYKAILAQARENAFASPFSVASAFAMVYAGAEKETLAELSKVLYFQNSPDFHTQQAAFQTKLQTGLPKALALEVANALWVKQQSVLLPDYQATMQNIYKAKITPTNFDNPKEACDAINQWTREKTQDKIKEIIKPAHIEVLTRLILTNAIYFKANWAKAFDKTQTQTHSFQVGAGKEEMCKFMHKQGFLKYFENEEMQIVELPYTDNRASMLVFLPATTSNLGKLEQKLTYPNYQKWTSSLAPTDTRVFLPTFKIESDFSLNEDLKEMGIKLAFTEQAQFDKIMVKTPLHISQVLHKSFVEVNEEGTEAAAVTAIIMNTTESAHEELRPRVFFANRPFIFLIKDNQTGAILFVGKVLNPKS